LKRGQLSPACVSFVSRAGGHGYSRRFHAILANRRVEYFLKRAKNAEPQRSRTPCCSSKHDSKLFRSTGIRGCAPFGAALRYCTGHAMGWSSSRAHRRDGKCGRRPFKKRTADIAAALEKIGQTRGRNSQVNGSGAAGAALVG